LPIHVNDLKPGDRVVLNCPKSQRDSKREAIFKGVYASHAAAIAELAFTHPGGMKIYTPPSILTQRLPVAAFLLQSADRAGMVLVWGAFTVQPDGSLREDQGLRVFIEQRVRMGQG
jgi:NADPH:quinone reductase-like Zn-dependent oxidoreductase